MDGHTEILVLSVIIHSLLHLAHNSSHIDLSHMVHPDTLLVEE